MSDLKTDREQFLACYEAYVKAELEKIEAEKDD